MFFSDLKRFPMFHNAYLLLAFALIGLTKVSAQSTSMGSSLNKPESLVKELYDQVTFSAKEAPDWDYVRTLFIPEATVVMRMSQNRTATLTLDGWILDFVNFIHDSDIKSTGFEEKIIKMKSTIFGDIAHVMVLYTSFIPGVSKSPREGIDSFHLIRKKGRWWIVSILNEIPGPNRPKPPFLN